MRIVIEGVGLQGQVDILEAAIAQHEFKAACSREPPIAPASVNLLLGIKHRDRQTVNQTDEGLWARSWEDPCQFITQIIRAGCTLDVERPAIFEHLPNPL